MIMELQNFRMQVGRTDDLVIGSENLVAITFSKTGNDPGNFRSVRRSRRAF